MDVAKAHDGVGLRPVGGDDNAQARRADDVERTGLYVEVEDESGSSERRLRKWRNQAALQGRAAIAAVTPAARTNLVNEARAAGCEHGVATDLQTLMETQETGGPLWMVEW